MLKALKEKLRNLLSKRIIRNDGDQCVEEPGNKLVFKRFSLRLLSRDEIQEVAHDFPVSSHKELNQAIKLFKESTFDSSKAVVYFPLPINDGKVNVLFWSFDKKIANSHFICLPEHLVLASASGGEESLLQVESRRGTYYIYRNKFSLRSMINSSLWSLNQVLFSFGGSSKCNVLEVTDKVSNQQLESFVANIKLNQWAGFISKRSSNVTKENLDLPFLTKLAFLVIGVWIGYAAIVTALLKFTLAESQEKLVESRSQIGNIQQSYQSVSADLAMLNKQTSELNSYIDVNKAISVLSSVINKENANFVRMSLKGGKMTVTLEAVSATDFINSLKNHPLVNSAVFSQDVRNRGGLQRFGVEFSLNNERALNDE